MKFLPILVTLIGAIAAGHCFGQTVLFEDNFDDGLSEKWQVVGLGQDDYRIREGALEIRVRPLRSNKFPMLKVDLPFTTEGTVIASVDISVAGERLRRGEYGGLCLTDHDGVAFTAEKKNIDGYFVFAPGEPEFIGEPGEEGDSNKYAVKYWPAAESAGPVRIIVRGHYAHFQVGPSAKGKYLNFFHSAISKSETGMGFALTAIGDSSETERWVRFDNFRVTR